MADPDKQDSARPRGSLQKRSGETHSVDYGTTPQVPVQEPLDPFPGRVFGDYEILERIARGGMGVVYKARQISLNRLVALKIIPGSELANPVERQRFRIEVEAAASIDHPRIVPIYEVGERDAYYFYSMRLIEGGNLAQHMSRYREDHRAAARLIISAARGIHYAHQRGILHRDLKPANILLDNDGRPHVADFGVAKNLHADLISSHRAKPDLEKQSATPASADPALDSHSRHPGSGELDLTQVGEIVGTPSYMAPEQASGRKGVITVAVDIYSLGAILYEMLTGRPPFKGPTRMATVRQVLTERPIPPRQLNPRLDRDLENICLKCLEREPQNRYPSAEALAEDLERWLAGEPVLASPARWWYRTVKWMRRRPTMAALVAATAIVSTLGLAGVAWQAQLAHCQAKRAALAESALLQERDQLRQNSIRYRRLETIRLVQAAWDYFQQGDYRLAHYVLQQVPPDQRRWEWRLLATRLQSVHQPVASANSCLAVTWWQDSWCGLTGDGRLLRLGSPSVSEPAQSQVFLENVPVSATGERPGTVGLLAANSLLSIWNSQSAVCFTRANSSPFWTWQGQCESVFAVRISPHSGAVAVIYRSAENHKWYVAYFPDRPASPRTWLVPDKTLRACEFVGTDYLLAVGESGKLLIWPVHEPTNAANYWQADLAASIERASLNGQGYFVLVHRDQTWRLGRWQPGWNQLWLEDIVPASAPIQAVALSEDGKALALALADSTIEWRQQKGPSRRLCLPKKLAIAQLHLSPHNDELVCRSTSGEVYIIPLQLGQRISRRSTNEVAPAYSAANQKSSRLYNWPANLNIKQTVAAQAVGKLFALTSEGKLLTANLPDNGNRVVDSWRECPLEGKSATNLAWSDTRRSLLVSLADNSLKLATVSNDDPATWTWKQAPGLSPVSHLAMEPDGEWFATADAEGRLTFWDSELLCPVLTVKADACDCKRLVAEDHGLRWEDSQGRVWFWALFQP